MNKWLLRLMASGMLLLALFAAALFFLAGTEAGLHSLTSICNRLSAKVVTIGAASGSLWSTLHLRNIRYDDGVDAVVVDALDLTWDPSRLLDGHIRIGAVHGSGVQVRLGDSVGETVLAPFSFPGRLVIERVSVDGATIFSDQVAIWRLDTATLANLIYHGQSLTFDDLTLIGKESTIRAKGGLQTGNDYPLQSTIEALIRPEGYQPIAGRGTISGPINGLHIDADLHSPFPAHLSGRLNKLLGATTWEAQAQCPAAALPAIHHDWPEQRFADVVVTGRGTLDDYSLVIQSSAGLPGLKEATALAAELEGDFDGIRIQTLHLAQGKSSLAAKGRLAWNPALSWEAEVRGAHINPSLVFADWPGDFSCILNTEGSFDGDDIRASFRLPQLQGTLRRFPLAGKGEAHLQGRQVRIPFFALTSAGSVLQIQGQVTEAIDLSLKLHSGNLAELWPNARGKVDLNAKFTGPLAAPSFALTLAGAGIGFGGNRVETINLETKGTLVPDGSLAATGKAQQALIGGLNVAQANVQLQGSLNNHTLLAEGRTPNFSAGITAQGTYADHHWQGALRQARLTQLTGAALSDWRQQQPTALFISTEKVELQPLCLTAPSHGRLCLNGSWQPPSGDWQGYGSLVDLPLRLITDHFQSLCAVEGQINGALDLIGKHAKIITGKLAADASNVAVGLPLGDGGEQRLQWQKNSVRINYANGRLQATLGSELSDDSSVQAACTLTAANHSATALRQAPMLGTVQIRLHDLSLVNLLTAHIVNLSGAVLGHVTVAGVPAAPLISGKIELVNGQAEIPPLGITLEPLLVSLQGDEKTVHFQATGRSGAGQLLADSAIHLRQPHPQLGPVHFTGQNFQAVRLPGLELDISPDVTLSANNGGRREIRGKINIPKARITSIDIHHATAPSKDIVVLDDNRPPEMPAASPLLIAVDLTAGDDVQVDAYGLRGAVTGNVHVEAQQGRPLVGNGTLNVHNGSFSIYGQRLNINLGRLLFSGGPLTNPGIELRSENKTEKVTTGVVVDGFLQHPNISFYSTPAMEQSAIVSHLFESTALGGETRQDVGLLGKAAQKAGLGGLVPYLQSIKTLSMIDEIKLETGDNYDDFSVVFGSWITPSFYVGYGKDLVKESGSFNTRYTLGSGFYFLTETGAVQSGGDLLYEFER